MTESYGPGFDNFIHEPDRAPVHAWADNWIFYINKSATPDAPCDIAMSLSQMEYLAILWLEYRGYKVGSHDEKER